MIFAIETSCDETSCAVYDPKRTQLLSNIIFSQIDIHKKFGGVLPEQAAQTHLEKINLAAQEALEQANSTLADISTFAVTHKPGLPGSLLIGLCFAKGLAWSLKKNIIGVNHLDSHVFSTFLEHDVPFPHICLTASGGHTSIYLVENYLKLKLLGTTQDDAAGEAFDKIAKLLELPYPGGPEIERLAAQAHFVDYYHYPRTMPNSLDFSFSGLKTAVLYDMAHRNLYNLHEKKLTSACTATEKIKIASSLLACIKDIFIQKFTLAIKKHPTVKALTLVGGVACNKFIRGAIQTFAQQHNCTFYAPSPILCTDNAGMIAYVAYLKAAKNDFSNYTLDIF